MCDDHAIDPHPFSRRQMLRAGAFVAGATALGTAVGWAPPAFADDPAVGADGAPPEPGQSSKTTASGAPGASTSYNGWSVGSPGSTIGVRNYAVPGTGITLPIRSGDVATILVYVARRFHYEVEPLQGGQCFGYSYRANVNNPSVWSNHASATAIDLNARLHPNGARNTFSAAQIAAMSKILDFCNGVVYWGQNYSGTVDGMHVEIDESPSSDKLRLLATLIRTGAAPASGAAAYVDRTGGYHVFAGSRLGGLTELAHTKAAGWKGADLRGGLDVRGTPAVLYRNGRCELFVLSQSGEPFRRTRVDGSGWSDWQRIAGSNLIGGLEVVADAAGTRHLFANNADGALYHLIGGSSGWSTQNLSHNGRTVGAPAATYANGRYDVFGIGGGGVIYQQTYVSSAGWSRWHSIGGSGFAGGLDAVREPSGTYRVFGVSTTGRLIERTYRGNGVWVSSDLSAGGAVGGTPSLVTVGSRRDLFAIAGDVAVFQKTSSSGGAWSSWHRVGTIVR